MHLQNELHLDVQSPFHRASHTMINKTKRKPNRGVKPSKTKQPKQKKSTPFGDVGEILGGAVGKMFNLNLQGPGRWLGSGIGSIFGSGDYTLAGAAPKENVIMNGSQIPKFSTTRATNVVCHREYLRDWTGVNAFSNESFRLNPGDSETFPWLSTIAQNYQEYKFHGLVFEFRSLITDFVTSGAPGVVVMATNYNANEPAYGTKQEMENSEFAVAVKPTLNLMHGVECAVQQTVDPIKYVRRGGADTTGDSRLYDLGTFQFANQGSPNQLLGELWVSYCVEFFKPVLPDTVGGAVDTGLLNTSSITAGGAVGTIQVGRSGNIDIRHLTSTTFQFYARANAYYIINYVWQGSVAGVAAYPAISSPALNTVQAFGFPTATFDNFTAPPGGTSTLSMEYTQTYRCILANDGPIVVTLTGGVFPTTTTNCNIIITRIDDTMIRR